LVFKSHEWWAKSGDASGYNSWTKVPHTNVGWELTESNDWFDKQETDEEVAHVSAPVWFATNGVSSSGVSTSWSFFAIIKSRSCHFSLNSN
jgi:hypothetical protein